MEDQDYILFENYLSGELSKDETIVFENRLKKDLEFEKAFATYKDLNSFLEHKIGNETEIAAFKENLENISDKYFSKTETVSEVKQKAKRFKFAQYAIAASVALLVGIFVFNQFSNPTYSDFNSHTPFEVAVRGENVELLIKTTKAFNNKEYEKASLYLEELLKENSENKEYQLYYAITNIELDRFEKSDTVLKALSQGSSAYKNKATWYLALSKFKQKENETSVELLKQIPETADDYKQAQKLLRKID